MKYNLSQFLFAGNLIYNTIINSECICMMSHVYAYLLVILEKPPSRINCVKERLISIPSLDNKTYKILLL